MAANQSPDKPQVFRSPTAVIVWIVWLLFAVGNWVDLAVQGRDHTSAVAAAILLLATGAAYVTAQRPRIIADETGLTVRNPLRDYRIGWAGVAKVDLADMLRVHCQGGAGGTGPAGSGGLREVAPPGQHNKVIIAWAIHYSRRRQFAAEARARRPARSSGLRGSSLGLPSGGRGLSYGAPVSAPEASSAEAEADKIVRVLSERATAARSEAVWAGDLAEAAGAEAAGRTAAAAGTGTGTAAGTGTASPVGATALDADRAGVSEPLKSTWSGRAIAALVIPALILLVVWLL
jgi:PH (Pleckstrin Homology) domain-containing protein